MYFKVFLNKCAKMKRMYYGLLVLVTFCGLPLVMTKSGNAQKMDPVSKARCDLVCADVDHESRTTCRNECRDLGLKPGACPSSDSPKWAEACVKACNVDSQCDGIQRCCLHGCGSTCSEPVDLLTLPGLPGLPTIVELIEKRRNMVVRWSDGVGDLARAVPGRILYILEEQHHLGPKYEEGRLDDWNFVLRTNKTKVSLRNMLKPGRWYRFRVAAVSAAGTRGFSQPSTPYTLRRGPRPPPQPKKLKVVPLSSSNGTITARLKWKEPFSDLPVLRYKVFWSRRLRGVQTELDSVVVNHETVPKNQHHFDIKDLQPNSMYFIQIQTISQYGLAKLRSNKAAIFYNTTNINGLPNINNPQKPELYQKKKHNKTITGLRLNKIIWLYNNLKADISWEKLRSKRHDGQPQRYFVQWEVIKCQNKTTKPIALTKTLAATTEETSFELYDLDYSCSYKVNVNKSAKSKKPDSVIVFSVPDCEKFRRKRNNINCEI